MVPIEDNILGQSNRLKLLRTHVPNLKWNIVISVNKILSTPSLYESDYIPITTCQVNNSKKDCVALLKLPSPSPFLKLY